MSKIEESNRSDQRPGAKDRPMSDKNHMAPGPLHLVVGPAFEHSKNCNGGLNEPCDCVLSSDDDIRKENREMRLALCIAHAGAGAYLDDGEMQDNTCIPCIDWKRDPWCDIKAKLVSRNCYALALVRPNTLFGRKPPEQEVDCKPPK